MDEQETGIEELKDIIIKMQEIELTSLTNDLSNIIGFSQIVLGFLALIAAIGIAVMVRTNIKVSNLQKTAESDIKTNNKLLEDLKLSQAEIVKKEAYISKKSDDLIKLTEQMNNTLSSGDFKVKLEELEGIMNEYKSTEWYAVIDNIHDKLHKLQQKYPIYGYQLLAYEYDNLIERSNSLSSDINSNSNLNNIKKRLSDLEMDVNRFEIKANSPHFREDY